MFRRVLRGICRNFSSSSNNSEWVYTYGNTDLEFRNPSFPDSFYANGNCEENEGYVSINLFGMVEEVAFRARPHNEINFVSVVDVAGKKRFTQSITLVIDAINYPRLEEDYFFGLERYLKRETLLGDPAELLPGGCLTVDNINTHDLKKGFFLGLERYLERETLLNDPAELLPRDCLTVCVEFELTLAAVPYQGFKIYLYESYRPITFDKVNKPCISLDTPFGRELYRVSEVFQYASDLPVMEAITRQVPIKLEEVGSFTDIFRIFSGYEELEFRSISDIWDLYRVADKYDINWVIETSRQFINAILRSAENPKFRIYTDQRVSEILEFADRYRDDDMKHAVETYLQSKEYFGTEHYAFGQYLNANLYTEWKFEMTVRGSSRPPFFIMKRRVVEPEFQFYQ